MNRERRQTAIITGANKGIGLEVARRLGHLHYDVWLGCRDVERGEKAAASLREEGIAAQALVVDVTSEESVAAAAAAYGRENAALDVLVNNAGINIGAMTPPSESAVDSMRHIYEVNTFGPVRVTQAFLPFLRRGHNPRVVMMSSSLGSISLALDPTSDAYGVSLLGYCSSKAALNMITVLFAKELLGTVKVNAVNPGFTATDLNGHLGHRSAGDAAEAAVMLATIKHDGPTAGFFHDGAYNLPGRHAW